MIPARWGQDKQTWENLFYFSNDWSAQKWSEIFHYFKEKKFLRISRERRKSFMILRN